MRLGLRWIVEGTNSWWSNYGQLDATPTADAGTATQPFAWPPTMLIVGRLITYRDSAGRR